jgi:hypothetical protein
MFMVYVVSLDINLMLRFIYGTIELHIGIVKK